MASQGYIVEWFPKKMFSHIEVGSDSDDIKKCTFTIHAIDFKTSGIFTKKPAEGAFSVRKLDERSVQLSIEKDGKRILVCNIRNLPGRISNVPAPEFKDDMIKITVEKAERGEWRYKLGNPDIVLLNDMN